VETLNIPPSILGTIVLRLDVEVFHLEPGSYLCDLFRLNFRANFTDCSLTYTVHSFPYSRARNCAVQVGTNLFGGAALATRLCNNILKGQAPFSRTMRALHCFAAFTIYPVGRGFLQGELLPPRERRTSSGGVPLPQHTSSGRRQRFRREPVFGGTSKDGATRRRTMGADR